MESWELHPQRDQQGQGDVVQRLEHGARQERPGQRHLAATGSRTRCWWRTAARSPPTPAYYVFRHLSQYVVPGAPTWSARPAATPSRSRTRTAASWSRCTTAARPTANYVVAIGGKKFQFAMPGQRLGDGEVQAVSTQLPFTTAGGSAPAVTTNAAQPIPAGRFRFGDRTFDVRPSPSTEGPPPRSAGRTGAPTAERPAAPPPAGRHAPAGGQWRLRRGARGAPPPGASRARRGLTRCGSCR